LQEVQKLGWFPGSASIKVVLPKVLSPEGDDGSAFSDYVIALFISLLTEATLRVDRMVDIVSVVLHEVKDFMRPETVRGREK
jgi:hypothetical protein